MQEGRQTDRWTDMQVGRRADIQRDTQEGRKAGRESGRKFVGKYMLWLSHSHQLFPVG